MNDKEKPKNALTEKRKLDESEPIKDLKKVSERAFIQGGGATQCFEVVDLIIMKKFYVFAAKIKKSQSW